MVPMATLELDTEGGPVPQLPIIEIVADEVVAMAITLLPVALSALPNAVAKFVQELLAIRIPILLGTLSTSPSLPRVSGMATMLLSPAEELLVNAQPVSPELLLKATARPTPNAPLGTEQPALQGRATRPEIPRSVPLSALPANITLGTLIPLSAMSVAPLPLVILLIASVPNIHLAPESLAMAMALFLITLLTQTTLLVPSGTTVPFVELKAMSAIEALIALLVPSPQVLQGLVDGPEMAILNPNLALAVVIFALNLPVTPMLCLGAKTTPLPPLRAALITPLRFLLPPPVKFLEHLEQGEVQKERAPALPSDPLTGRPVHVRWTQFVGTRYTLLFRHRIVVPKVLLHISLKVKLSSQALVFAPQHIGVLQQQAPLLPLVGPVFSHTL